MITPSTLLSPFAHLLLRNAHLHPSDCKSLVQTHCLFLIHPSECSPQLLEHPSFLIIVWLPACTGWTGRMCISDSLHGFCQRGHGECMWFWDPPSILRGAYHIHSKSCQLFVQAQGCLHGVLWLGRNSTHQQVRQPSLEVRRQLTHILSKPTSHHTPCYTLFAP